MKKRSLCDAGAVFRAGTIRREHVFVTTKLWNTDYRPQRVERAFDASLRRLTALNLRAHGESSRLLSNSIRLILNGYVRPALIERIVTMVKNGMLQLLGSSSSPGWVCSEMPTVRLARERAVARPELSEKAKSVPVVPPVVTRRVRP